MSRKKAVQESNETKKANNVLKRGLHAVALAGMVIHILSKYGPKVAETVKKIKES